MGGTVANLWVVKFDPANGDFTKVLVHEDPYPAGLL